MYLVSGCFLENNECGFVSILFLFHGSKNVFICLESAWHILFSLLVEIWEATLALFYSEKLTVEMLKYALFAPSAPKNSNLRPTEGILRQEKPVIQVAARSTYGGTESTCSRDMRGLFGNFVGGEKGSFTCQFLGLSLEGDLIIKCWVIFSSSIVYL